MSKTLEEMYEDLEEKHLKLVNAHILATRHNAELLDTIEELNTLIRIKDEAIRAYISNEQYLEM